jgi:hypothetical protein
MTMRLPAAALRLVRKVIMDRVTRRVLSPCRGPRQPGRSSTPQQLAYPQRSLGLRHVVSGRALPRRDHGPLPTYSAGHCRHA